MVDSQISQRSQPQERSIEQEFAQLYKIMSSRDFRHSRSTGGEEPYYIYDYPATQELEVREQIGLLRRNLQLLNPQDADDYAPQVLEINLYDAVLGVFEQRGILDRVLNIEESRHTTVSSHRETDKYFSMLDRILNSDVQNIQEWITQRYKDKKAEHKADIIFLTGVGAVYPLVRTHRLLENLQGYIDDCPVVVFYPGEYTQGSESGSSLRLFGILPSNNYYRARSLRNMR